MSAPMPHLAFGSPRGLPRPAKLTGRVAVLDIAFAATSGGGVSFEEVTLPFIKGLGDRLAAWVDHHDHDRHGEYAGDPRFILATKAQHGACPEMVTPEVVRQAGPVDTILCHVDLDGLYSAAKWIRGGVEPYRGADDDARAVDTRIGQPGPIGRKVDRALRARFRDEDLKRRVIQWLVADMPAGPLAEAIDEAAAEFDARDRGSRTLTARYVVRGRVAYVDASGSAVPYDKTDLLLAGQAMAEVAVVRDSGYLTVAAGFDSGWDFVALLQLEGGMPTRVTVPEARLDELLDAIARAPRPSAD